MIDKTILKKELRKYKKTNNCSEILFKYIKEIIEVEARTTGVGLNDEDTIQELWYTVFNLLKKINTNKNSFAYLHTCCRNRIIDIFNAKKRELRIIYRECDSQWI